MASLHLAWFYPFFHGLFLGLLAMVLHEAGHLLTALAVGTKIRAIGFHWKGLYTVREAGPPAKNLLISLAGPLVNVALILTWNWSHTFGLANVCFAVVNLLPTQGSDGERVLRCFRQLQLEALEALPVPVSFISLMPRSVQNLYARMRTPRATKSHRPVGLAYLRPQQALPRSRH